MSQPRVSLRAVVRSDLPALFEHQADPVACEMAAVRPRDAGVFASRWENTLRNSALAARTILLNETIVGTISAFLMDGLPSVGYWIARDHRASLRARTRVARCSHSLRRLDWIARSSATSACCCPMPTSTGWPPASAGAVGILTGIRPTSRSRCKLAL